MSLSRIPKSAKNTAFGEKCPKLELKFQITEIWMDRKGRNVFFGISKSFPHKKSLGVWNPRGTGGPFGWGLWRQAPGAGRALYPAAGIRLPATAVKVSVAFPLQ